MSRATDAQIQQRVEEVLAIRLDGAEFWDVREYAREREREEDSPWHLKEGQKPLSDPQLWRYIARADQLIAESCRSSRKKLLRRHLAQRRNLYAKAVKQGDVRAALACLQDEADLEGLYEFELVRELEKVRREVEELKRNGTGSTAERNGKARGGSGRTRPPR